MGTLDPYADAEAVKAIEPPISKPRIGNASRFRVRNHIMYRDESCGTLAAIREEQGSPSMITPDTRVLLEDVSGRDFSVTDLALSTGITVEDAEALCSLLFHDKLLVEA